MVFVGADWWCTGKCLRLDQTVRNITSSDMEISLVVIQQGVTRLKKIRLVLFKIRSY